MGKRIFRLEKTIRYLVIGLFSLFIIVVSNACYWLFSDIQFKCAEKIAKGYNTSIYEKASILSLHLGICTIGTLYCPEAAYANFKMLTTKEDTVYIHSNNWITPKIIQRFNNKQFGKMSWNGNIDYAFNSPERNGAVLLNWCILKEQIISGKLCYVAECDYTWKVPSRTEFKITENFKIILYEQLFYELEKCGILHPYKLKCYYEK
jgi:hypothetical protein